MVALEALVNRFGRQIGNREEMLASGMDVESAAKAPRLAELQEFQSTLVRWRAFRRLWLG